MAKWVVEVTYQGQTYRSPWIHWTKEEAEEAVAAQQSFDGREPDSPQYKIIRVRK